MEYSIKELSPKLRNYGLLCLIAGAIGIGVSFSLDVKRAFFMYNVMFNFMISIGLGAMFIVAVEHISGAVWSVPFRRVAEYVSGVIPVVAILGLPLVIQLWGHDNLFHWTHPEVFDPNHESYDKILDGKKAYLNIPFFTIRYVLFFLLWTVYHFIFLKSSTKQDVTKDQKISSKNVRNSAIFICLMALTMTFSAIDWMMSLEAHWFSTMWGVYYFAGTVMSGFAIVGLFSILLKEKGYLHPKTNTQQFYPFGNFMFAFNCFWCYIAFCQFMLIWYGNLPEETFWFQPRWEGTWKTMSFWLMILHFPVPFYALVSRGAKTNPKRLKFMAVYLLLIHFYDMFWIIMPSVTTGNYAGKHDIFQISDLGYVFGAIGIILVVFYFKAKGKNLVPVGDPKLERGLNWHP